ncbi:MAG: response regulator transcription factor [Candidatus Izemoplasmatales bacterium]|jgi:two-component system alkaline phosphatase synthesis response regulator PhoP|nr:response regulator transcription factor [Candidatus Izemoplasmatales bacterium]
MGKPIIYSVEDDLNIQNVIRIALQNTQFEIVCFSNAHDLFNQLEKSMPDLFLLDIMLPDMDGIEIIKKIKKQHKLKNIPIMVISAKTSEIDKVIGLDTGADDYLIKPFGVLELVSRVKALLRRNIELLEEDSISINGLSINKKEYSANYDNKIIRFTKKQFELLEYLMQKKDKLITRDEILNNVWGYDFFGETRTLDVHIKELRKKLKNAGIIEPTIETIRGVGYKFVL